MKCPAVKTTGTLFLNAAFISQTPSPEWNTQALFAQNYSLRRDMTVYNINAKS